MVSSNLYWDAQSVDQPRVHAAWLWFVLTLIGCSAQPRPSTPPQPDKELSIAVGESDVLMGPPSVIAFPEPVLQPEESVSSVIPRLQMIKRSQGDLTVIQLWINAGPLKEGKRERGATALLDDLILGSPTQTKSVLSQLKQLGATVQSQAFLDRYLIEVELLSSDTAQGLAILGDAIRNPTWGAQELEEAKQSELAVLRSKTQWLRRRIALRLLSTLRTKRGHSPVWLSSEEQAEQLSDLSLDTMQSYFRRVTRSESCSLILAGSFDEREVNPTLVSSWQEAPSSHSDQAQASSTSDTSSDSQDQTAQFTKPSTERPQPRVAFEESSTKSALITLLFPISSFSPQDASYLDLLSLTLADHQTGLLRSAARTAGIDLYFAGVTPVITDEDTGVIITLQVNQSQVREAWTMLMYTLNELISQPLSQRKLEQAKRHLERETILISETLSGQAQRLGFFSSYWPRETGLKSYGSSAYRATPARLLSFTKRVFSQRSSLGVIVSPPPSDTTTDIWQERFNEQLDALSAPQHTVTKEGFNRYGSNINVLFSPSDSGGITSLYVTIPIKSPRRFRARHFALGHWQSAQLSESLQYEPKFNASFHGQTISLSGTFPSSSMGEALTLLMRKLRQAPMRSEPLWSSELLEKARRTALINLDQLHRSPSKRLSLLDQRVFFSTQSKLLPLEHARRDSLRDASSSELMRWFRENIQSQELYVVISGDVEKSKLESVLSSITPEVITPPSVDIHKPHITSPVQVFSQCHALNVSAKEEQGIALLSYPVPTKETLSFPLVHLIESAVAQRVRQQIDDPRVDIHIVKPPTAHHQRISIAVQAPTDRMPLILQGIRKSLKELTQGLFPDRLQQLKRYAKLRVLRRTSTSLGYAQWLAQGWFHDWQTSGLKTLEQWKMETDAIKLDQFKLATETMIKDEQLRLVQISPPRHHKTISSGCRTINL